MQEICDMYKKYSKGLPEGENPFRDVIDGSVTWNVNVFKIVLQYFPRELLLKGKGSSASPFDRFLLYFCGGRPIISTEHVIFSYLLTHWKLCWMYILK